MQHCWNAFLVFFFVVEWTGIVNACSAVFFATLCHECRLFSKSTFSSRLCLEGVWCSFSYFARINLHCHVVILYKKLRRTLIVLCFRFLSKIFWFRFCRNSMCCMVIISQFAYFLWVVNYMNVCMCSIMNVIFWFSAHFASKAKWLFESPHFGAFLKCWLSVVSRLSKLARN